jgi:hypothetical protein
MSAVDMASGKEDRRLINDPGPRRGLHLSRERLALSALHHHVLDLEWMKEAYRLTRKDGAPGIDGVTRRLIAA